MGLTADRNSIKDTYGTIDYETNFYIDWPSGSYNQSIDDYSGSICGISVNKASGTVTIQNLSPGTSYSYTENSITCSYSYNYDEKIYGTDTEGKPTVTTIKRSGEGEITNDLGDITIYTHPGSFSMGAVSAKDNPNSPNSIIANVLTEDKINNEWIPFFQKVYRWWNQQGSNYNTQGMTVISNTPITHTWFNACMDAMNQFGREYSHVTGGPNGTIITAELINQLNFYGIS